jgi:hypothetical protein
MTSSDESFDVIYAYTRAQAIEDGVLIDVSPMAREAGFKFPVAITCGLWSEYIKPSDDDALSCQSIEGRLWDTLMVFHAAARHSDDRIVHFNVSYLMKGRKMESPQLKGVVGPGDKGEPVITIMMIDED